MSINKPEDIISDEIISDRQIIPGRITIRHRGRNGLEFNANNTKVLNPETGRYINTKGFKGKLILANAGIIPTVDRRLTRAGTYQPSATYRNGQMESTEYTEVDLINRPAVSTVLQFAQSIMQKRNELGDDFRNVKYSFTNDEGERIYRTMKSNNINNVVDIVNEVNRVQTGNYAQTIDTIHIPKDRSDGHGSDIITNGFNLELDTFSILRVIPPSAGGSKMEGKSHDNNVFRYRDYKCADGDCLLAIFRVESEEKIPFYNNRLRQHLNIPSGNISFEHIPKLCDIFKTGIEIYSDKVDIKVSFKDDCDKNHAITKASNQLLFKYGGEYKKIIMVYMTIVDGSGSNPANHYSHIIFFKPFKICKITGDNINIVGERTSAQIEARILEQGRTLFAKTKKLKEKKTKLLFFDFETIWNPTKQSKIEPYSVAWYVCDSDEADKDFNLDMDRVSVAYGDKCHYELVDFIRRAQETKYLLISFNGSRFDNFILASAASGRECLSDIFWSDGCIRSLRMFQHQTLDIAKLNPGMSLKKSCDDFKTTPKKIDGFDHTVVQTEYLNGNLKNWLKENIKEATAYVKTDVLCLASLTIKMRDALVKLTGLNPLDDPQGLGTAGSVAWRALNSKSNIPKALPQQVDEFCRKAITGGRTQNFMEKGFKSIGQYRMVDVKSEYPTVMFSKNHEHFNPKLMYGLYPTSDAIPTDKYVEGKLGVYRVKVLKQPNIKILAKREEGIPLDWNCNEEFETHTTNCSIELLKLHGGECEIYEGYYFEECSRDLFKGFLQPLFDEKDKQDKLKADKSPEANGAMRAICKILMNSSSGKTLQRNYDDLCILVKGTAEQLSAESKMKNNKADDFIPLNSTSGIMIGKMKSEKVYNIKKAKPSQLGIFIYEYARTYLYEMLLKKYNPMYCDTDSCLMSQTDYDQFVIDQPEISRGNSLGEIGEELGNYDNCEIILMAPKMYMVCPTINNIPIDKEHIKFKIKGICIGKDKMILNDYLKTLEDYSTEELYNEYNNADSKMLIPITKDPRPVFNKLAGGDSVNILCAQMSRHLIVINRERIEPFQIRQRFLIKRIA